MSILSRFLRILILSIAVLLIIIGIMSSFVDKAGDEIEIDLDLEKVLAQEQNYIQQRTDKDTIPLEEANQIDPYGAPTFSYTIKKGETVGKAFDNINMYSQLVHFMEADSSEENGLIFVLDKVNPGNELVFWVDQDSNKIQKMQLQFSLDNWAEFVLQDDGTYSVKEVTLEGDWNESIHIGEVYGSFSVSAVKEGIGSREIGNIEELLQNKLDFKDLRAGDRFEVIQEKQTIKGVESGKRRITAVKIYNRNRLISAYKFKDQYFDAEGRSLQRAFLLWPLDPQYRRLTSRFNPKRRHPVTGRIAPHNGEDIATPIGANVYAAGDGEVIASRFQKYAGNYITIKHDDTFVTRYLHLNRRLVKKGDKVITGQLIGKAGKTGRVTGPHLHYEFIVRGQPKSFLNVDIPTTKGLEGDDLSKFQALVKTTDKKFTDEIISRTTPKKAVNVDNSNEKTQLIDESAMEWKQDIVVGEIENSFGFSADKKGIYRGEIHKISELLKDRLNFIRDLRAGDKFEILQTKQIYQNKETGKRDVLAARIYNRGKVFSAYKFNQFYYDQNGEVLVYNSNAPILSNEQKEEFFDYIAEIDQKFSQYEG